MSLAEAPQITDDTRSSISSFVRNFSTETTPAGADKIIRFRDHLPPGTSVYVTFLPGSDFAATIRTARRLREEGFNPVPHLAARSVPSLAALDGYLGKLRGEADVTEILAIAGGLPRPLGPFPDSMKLLETGLLDKHGILRVGVAGHPEGSPDIPHDALAAALAWKNEFSRRTAAQLHIVTQMCFEPQAIIDWERASRAAGNVLPIRVGIPGIASIKTLLGYAKLCGIGPSTQFLIRQGRSLTKLLTPSTPDILLRQLARCKDASPGCRFIGCHVYPLGGLERTARWMNGVAAGRITLDGSASGFAVDGFR